MIIKLSPQVRDGNKIWYDIEYQKVRATINGTSDIFDFSGMPDGELKLRDDDTGKLLVESVLDEVPILSARKEKGQLYVEILFSIESNENDQRLLFPKPMSLDEFNRLMREISKREKEVEIDG